MKGHETPSTSSPFFALVEEWWTLDRPRLSPSTAKNYRALLDRRILPRLGDRPLDRLQVRDLDLWYAELGRDLSPNSVRNIHALVRRILNRGVAWGWIDRNPALYSTLPEQRGTEVTPPTTAQVKALLDAAQENPTLHVAVRLAASTGARRGQRCGVRWRDIRGGVLTMESTGRHHLDRAGSRRPGRDFATASGSRTSASTTSATTSAHN